MKRPLPPAAALAASAIILALALTACGGDDSPEMSAPTGSTAPGASIGQMPLEVRQADLPSEFPIEVPVPDGRVLAAEQQSERVWVYEIVLDASVADVMGYYERVYAGANWGLAEKSADEGVGSLLFLKGNAEATVDVGAEADGTHAIVAVGLGVPVGSTY